MSIELKQMTLEELGGGMVPELFGLELGRVLRNIDDVNTDAKATRSMQCRNAGRVLVGR